MTDDLSPERDPFDLFAAWLAEAKASELNDPEAMALAAVDAEGRPDVRIVLLKGHGPDGFVFYTNLESAKGRELAANPVAALCLHWKSLRRQVRVRGPIGPVTPAESDAYFASRARASRIASIASDQSRPLESRAALEARIVEVERRFEGREPERPTHWAGTRVVPLEIEFWRDGAHRVHDRLVWRRPEPSAPWTVTRLYP